MKNLLNANMVNVILLMSIAFLLPLSKKVMPFLIILLVGSWLMSGGLKERIRSLAGFKYVWLFVSYYLVHLLGMLYTSNTQFGWFDLEIKLSFLIMPLVIASLPKFDQRSVNNVLLGFVAGCFTASLLNLWLGYAAYSVSGDINDILYGELAHFHHPTYSSMYLCLALSIAGYFLHSKPQFGAPIKVVLFTSLPLFVIMIVMLMTKTGVMVLALIIILSFFYLLLNKRFVPAIILAAIVYVGAATTMKMIPDAFKRFKFTWIVATQAEEERDRTTIESTAGRIMVWEQATQLLKENWIFGVGTGDIKDELVAKYSDNGFTGIEGEKLNAHNQFLQTFCALGILGFLCLVLGLILPAMVAIRTRNIVQFLFLLIIIVNALTESILEVQAGVVFYAFFNSFFMFLNPVSIRENIA